MSREAILRRVRSALQHTATEPSAAASASQYQISGDLSAADRLTLFEHRLHEYGARTFLAAEPEVSAVILALLRDGGKQRVLAPAGLPAAWLGDGPQWTIDHGLPYEEMDHADGVLTAASVGVAVSGSIILQHGPAEGRRALTLLPDYHLCVLFENQIVETLPEAFARLAPDHSRPVTFVSGPSATADIEMTRVKGVHGPRFLDVIVVRNAAR